MSGDGSNRLGWLMTQVCDKTPVESTVLLSADGLAQAWSDGTDRDAADVMAASASGFAGLAEDMSQRFGCGEFRFHHMEFAEKQVMVMSVGGNSRLCVLAPIEVEPADLGLHMRTLIDQVSRHLAVSARPAETLGS